MDISDEIILKRLMNFHKENLAIILAKKMEEEDRMDFMNNNVKYIVDNSRE